MGAARLLPARPCRHCSTPFQPRANNNGPNRGKYCSVNCSNLGRSMPLLADPALIVEQWRSGLSAREIAALHGSTWKHVARSLRENGVDVRPGRKDRGRGGSRVYRKRAEQIAGRSLKAGECVHHLDGDRTNNAPSNLAIAASLSEHMRWHSQLERIALQLFKAGMISFSPTSGYEMGDALKEMMEAQ